MVDFNKLKQGDIIRIKSLFGVECTGIFDKMIDNKITLHCASFDDLFYVLFEINENKNCSFTVGSIKSCEFATEKEVEELYTKTIKYYIEVVDNDWYKYFTDSTYFEVEDWFAFNCKSEFYEKDNTPIGVENFPDTPLEEGYPDFVYKFSEFAWKYLCNEVGYCEEEDDNETIKKEKLYGEVTNRELQELLQQYPEDAIVSIEYCNIRELKYNKDKNLIVIE